MVTFYRPNIKIKEKDYGCVRKKLIDNSGSTITVKERIRSHCDKHKDENE